MPPSIHQVDLEEELVDEDVRAHLLQHAAVRVQEAGVAAGDPEVGVAPASPVRFTAQPITRDLEVLRVRLQALLDLLGEVSRRRRCRARSSGTRS